MHQLKKRYFSSNLDYFQTCFSCRLKNQNKHSILNLSFDALSKWDEPDINLFHPFILPYLFKVTSLSFLGFPGITKVAYKKGAFLYMPPPKKKGKQFHPNENKIGYEISKLRVHVEVVQFLLYVTICSLKESLWHFSHFRGALVALSILEYFVLYHGIWKNM